jgi:putative endonuclease
MKKKSLSRSSSWWVYIIETEKGTLYTGITTDLERRFRQHAGEIKGGAKYFNGATPVRIRFKKKFPDRSSASKHEAHIKSLSRAEKLLLLKN